MRKLIFLLLLAVASIPVVQADHNLPKTATRETFFLGVTGYEHDPQGVACNNVLEAWEQQGYEADPNDNSFVNYAGLYTTTSLWTIEQTDDLLNVSPQLELLPTLQHGSATQLSMELYLADPGGVGYNTREQRWVELSGHYRTGGSNPEIGKGFNTGLAPEFCYHSIDIKIAFWQEEADWGCASSSKWHTSRLQNKRHFPEHCRPDDLLLSLRQGPVLTTPAA
jgi:hypothetical protein